MSTQLGLGFGAAGFDPPLKWAGGKRWLVPEFSKLFNPHRHRRLVEPFCGAAAIALGVRPARALLNDINPHLINFHRWLQQGLTIEIPMEKEECTYYSNRERFNQLARDGRCNRDGKQLAELFYYLNRTTYNGLCRFNKSKREFNAPFGKDDKPVSYQCDFTAYRAAYVDWVLTVGHFETVAVESDDFIYADPPYDGDDGAFTAYAGIPFDWQDHVELARWLARHPGPVVASNAATPRIVELYRDLGFALSKRQVPRTINSKANKRGPVAEILATRNLNHD
jgi:DNA adenine methylase